MIQTTKKLLIALVISMSVYGAPPKKAPRVKVQPAPKPDPVKELIKEIKSLSAIERYLVEEELLLEKCKETPRIYRNALVEMHEKRRAMLEQAWTTWFTMRVTDSDREERREALAKLTAEKQKMEAAVEKLEALKLD